MAKSKFFRVFVEGFTVSDGRKIEASWIDDIVATFNTANYTPRINVEHIKGYSPEPPFNGYGDVVAVKAQHDEFTIDGKTERRKALYVQVEPNEQLIAKRAIIVPFFPEDALMITSLDNLAIYVQEETRRRQVKDEPALDQIENYESVNEDFVVEDYGRAALVENIVMGKKPA